MKLGKHIFSVGAMTGISRIFGFIRDMLIARYLGAGRLSDIFLAAFKLPNLFRDLLGEGALSSIFVPMFTDQKKDKNFANNVFSWLMVGLLIITLVCQILMPLIVWILAPGFADDPGKMEMTVLVSRIMFFYVIFVCGAAFLSAVLNAFSRFALSAFMPVLLNVMLIGALLLFGRYAGNAILYIMSGTVVLSGIIQMSVLWSRIRAKNFGLRLIVPTWTPRMKSMFKRLGVSIFGSGFYQITIIVGTLVASFQSGAVSWLYYSDRLVQLPFAVIGLAAGTVLLSSFSNAMADKNMRSVHIQQNSTMRQSLMLIIPSVVGLFVLAHPIVKYLFEYGAWTPESTNAVAAAIMIQVFALPAMLISNVYSKTLYAAQDVRTPVQTSIVSLIVACVFYLSLFHFVGYLAIPIGIVTSGYLKNYMLARVCKKRGLFKIEKRTIRSVAAFSTLAIASGAGLWFMPITSIWWLGVAIAAYTVLYLSAAMLINKKI
ncbi:MAG: murein biosynthesis integral membrane protein MurJ [Rickettsiales bacterium]|jgi:putative peptidoglycan lipid II flippase|nr:murein biosynthesis integral membrane protein MurJ [Rickettsiales bacterium]